MEDQNYLMFPRLAFFVFGLWTRDKIIRTPGCIYCIVDTSVFSNLQINFLSKFKKIRRVLNFKKT